MESLPQKDAPLGIDKINISHIPKMKPHRKEKSLEFNRENLKKSSRALFTGGAIWYLMTVFTYLAGAKPAPLNITIEVLFGILFFILGTTVNKIPSKHENQTPKKSHLTIIYTMLWFIIIIGTFHTLKRAYNLFFEQSQNLFDLLILVLSIGMTALALVAILVLKIKPERRKIEKRERPLY
jgi:hypothetical protein